MKQELIKVPCEMCRDRLISYIRCLLDADTMASMRRHIDGCRACRREYLRLMTIDQIDEADLPPELLRLAQKLPRLPQLGSNGIRTVPDLLEQLRVVAAMPFRDSVDAETAILELLRTFSSQMLAFLGSISAGSERSLEMMQRELENRSTLMSGILEDAAIARFLPALRRFSMNLLNQGILIDLEATGSNPLPCLYLAYMLMIVMEDTPNQIRALRAIGESLFHEQHYNQAIDLFHHAIDLAIQASDQDEQRLAHRDLGSTLFQMGRYPEAIHAIETAIELSSRSPDAVEQAKDLNNLACVHYCQGKLMKAIEFGETALLRLEYTDSPHLKAQIMANTGTFLADAGHLQSAETRWTESLKEFAKLNTPIDTCHLHRNIAILKYRIGAFDTALDHLEVTLGQPRITDELRLFALLLKGRILRQFNDFLNAAHTHEEALCVARRLKNPDWLRVARVESAIDAAHLKGCESSFDLLIELKFFSRRTEPISIFYLENRVDAASIASAVGRQDLVKSMRTRAFQAARSLRLVFRRWNEPERNEAMKRVQSALDRLPNI